MHRFGLIAAAATFLSGAASADEMSFPPLMPADIPGAPMLGDPFLVMAGDGPVLTEKHGLAAPALWDWDGDGKRDLLVGEFETNAPPDFPMGADGSTIRVYLNVGTDSEPQFSEEFEWARDTEGTIMEVPQWCCREPWKLARAVDDTGLQEVLDDLLTVLESIAEVSGPFLPPTARRIQGATSIGFTPMFYDLDDDGYQDMITGQYHPGEVTWFRGSPDGFLPGETLPQEGDPADADDPDMNELRAEINPDFVPFEGEKGDIGSFEYWVFSSATFGDLDEDGDFDLIVGGSGGLRVSENIGGPNSPSFAKRELLLDINGQPLMTRPHTKLEKRYARYGDFLSPSGPGNTSPLAVDWDQDGVLDLLVTDSYREPKSRAVSFFRGVKTSHGHRFEPGIDLIPTDGGAKAIPGSGQRVYVDDWNADGVNDLIIGASVATVNGGEFSDELSWEWESVNEVESAGKDLGRYPPRPRPTLESQRKLYEEIVAMRAAEGVTMEMPSDEWLERQAKEQLPHWEAWIGRLYKEGKAHWLTMRHQGRVYVMLGKAPGDPARSVASGAP